MVGTFQCTLCSQPFLYEGLACLHILFHHQAAAEHIGSNEALEAEDISSLYVAPTQASPASQWRNIFKNVCSSLAKATFTLLSHSGAQDSLARCTRSYEALSSLQNFALNSNCVVHLLAGSNVHRARLLEVSSQLDSRQSSDIWEALKSDEFQIALLLKGVVRNRPGKTAILALRDAECDSILDLMESVLSNGSYWSESYLHNFLEAEWDEWNEFRKELRRLSIRLWEASDKLPAALHLRGISLENPNNIAGGAFADIYRGDYRSRKVAIKKPRIAINQPPQERARNARAFCREILMVHHLQHSNISELLGVDHNTFPGSVCLVSAWMQYGNIHNFIEKHGFALSEVHRFFMEISSGLCYLHEQNVVHGDLRGPNILIDDERHVRLADFGLANFADTTSASASSAPSGAIRWLAPEVLDPQRFGLELTRHTRASDVYSLASVYWEIYAGSPPFKQLTMPAALLEILAGNRPARSSCGRQIPEGLWLLMQSCWRQLPSERPKVGRVELQLCQIFEEIDNVDRNAVVRSPTRGSQTNNLPTRPAPNTRTTISSTTRHTPHASLSLPISASGSRGGRSTDYSSAPNTSLATHSISKFHQSMPDDAFHKPMADKSSPQLPLPLDDPKTKADDSSEAWASSLVQHINSVEGAAPPSLSILVDVAESEPEDDILALWSAASTKYATEDEAECPPWAKQTKSTVDVTQKVLMKCDSPSMSRGVSEIGPIRERPAIIKGRSLPAVPPTDQALDFLQVDPYASNLPPRAVARSNSDDSYTTLVEAAFGTTEELSENSYFTAIGAGSQTHAFPVEDSVTPDPEANWPLPRTVVVQCAYVPVLDDELWVEIGEPLRMLDDFADGWCKVQRITFGSMMAEQGVVPRLCLRELRKGTK